MTLEEMQHLRGYLARFFLELSSLKEQYRKYSDKLDSPTRSQIVDNFKTLDRTVERATELIEKHKTKP